MKRAGYNIKDPNRFVHRLLRVPQVKEKIDIARRKFKAKAKLNRESIDNLLSEGVLFYIDQKKYKDAKELITEINKMQGNYAPAQSEHKITNTLSTTEDLTNFYATNERAARTVQ